MHRIFRVKAYEAEHGPHFNEEHARKAVSKMENEDGTRGPHWSVEETTALASQYGINLGSRFNRYDWFVALNMVYSDYYKVIISMTNSNSTKHFYNVQPLFPFWGPFLFGRRRRRLNTISGIPVLKTTGVVATSTEVRYDVNYQEYRSLPNEGLFFLDVRQSSAEASASLPVGLSDGNSENNNQSMLRNALQEDVQAGNLQLNFRYLIYYNKCNNVYQLVNAYPANITAPSA